MVSFGTVIHSSSTESKSSSAIDTLCVCCAASESLGIDDKPGIAKTVDTAPAVASELTERKNFGGGGGGGAIGAGVVDTRLAIVRPFATN